MQYKLDRPGRLWSVGAVLLDPDTSQAFVCGCPVALSSKECAVLMLLMEKPGTPLSREVFVQRMYDGSKTAPDPRIIDVFVCLLGRKLAEAGAPGVIEAVWNQGYVVREPERLSPR